MHVTTCGRLWAFRNWSQPAVSVALQGLIDRELWLLPSSCLAPAPNANAAGKAAHHNGDSVKSSRKDHLLPCRCAATHRAVGRRHAGGLQELIRTFSELPFAASPVQPGQADLPAAAAAPACLPEGSELPSSNLDASKAPHTTPAKSLLVSPALSGHGLRAGQQGLAESAEPGMVSEHPEPPERDLSASQTLHAELADSAMPESPEMSEHGPGASLEHHAESAAQPQAGDPGLPPLDLSASSAPHANLPQHPPGSTVLSDGSPGMRPVLVAEPAASLAARLELPDGDPRSSSGSQAESAGPISEGAVPPDSDSTVTAARQAEASSFSPGRSALSASSLKAGPGTGAELPSSTAAAAMPKLGADVQAGGALQIRVAAQRLKQLRAAAVQPPSFPADRPCNACHRSPPSSHLPSSPQHSAGDVQPAAAMDVKDGYAAEQPLARLPVGSLCTEPSSARILATPMYAEDNAASGRPEPLEPALGPVANAPGADQPADITPQIAEAARRWKHLRTASLQKPRPAPSMPGSTPAATSHSPRMRDPVRHSLGSDSRAASPGVASLGSSLLGSGHDPAKGRLAPSGVSLQPGNAWPSEGHVAGAHNRAMTGAPAPAKLQGDAVAAMPVGQSSSTMATTAGDTPPRDLMTPVAARLGPDGSLSRQSVRLRSASLETGAALAAVIARSHQHLVPCSSAASSSGAAGSGGAGNVLQGRHGASAARPPLAASRGATDTARSDGAGNVQQSSHGASAARPSPAASKGAMAAAANAVSSRERSTARPSLAAIRDALLASAAGRAFQKGAAPPARRAQLGGNGPITAFGTGTAFQLGELPQARYGGSGRGKPDTDFGPAAVAEMPLVAVCCNPLYIPAAAAARSPTHSPLPPPHLHAVPRFPTHAPSVPLQQQPAGSSVLHQPISHGNLLPEPAEEQWAKPVWSESGMAATPDFQPRRLFSSAARPSTTHHTEASGNWREHDPRSHACERLHHAASTHSQGSDPVWNVDPQSTTPSLHRPYGQEAAPADPHFAQRGSSKPGSLPLAVRYRGAGHGQGRATPSSTSLASAHGLNSIADLEQIKAWTPHQRSSAAGNVGQHGSRWGGVSDLQALPASIAAAGQSCSPEGRLKGAMQRMTRIHARQAKV